MTENFKELHDIFLSHFMELVDYIEKNHQINEESVFDIAINIKIRIILYQLLNEKGILKRKLKDILKIKENSVFLPGLDIFSDLEISNLKPFNNEGMDFFRNIYDFFNKLSIDIKFEFLGNVFENLLNLWEDIEPTSIDESISKRLTKRKTKGVFYTPKNITHYMVDRILKEKIFDILNLEFLSISSLPEFIENSTKNQLMQIFEVIKDIKILDPACGSGAFLIEFCEELFNLRMLIGNIRGKELDPLKLKASIINNNIFGLDIISHAINLIKLRAIFWMFNELKELNDLKLLDLEQNFKVGNALYDFNWVDEFFPTFSIEPTGFDIVISNPPYGRTILTSQIEKLQDYFVSSKEKVKKPSYNASALFIELGIKLLNSLGYFAMIVPSSIARTEEFEGVRKYILEHSNLFEIVDEGKAFDATNVTLEMITIFVKKSKMDEPLVHVISKRDGTTRFINKDIFKKYDRFILYHDFIFDTIMDNSTKNLIHARSGIDHRLIKFKEKKDQVRKKSKEYTIPFLHSGKTIQRYRFDEFHFHFIREKNLTIERFTREFNEINLVSTAISPYIRATTKNKGLLPGTNVQIISFDDELSKIYYFLALLNSKLLRIFFHIYIQNKIKYTFKIQDYHVKYYPIKYTKDEKIFSLLANILINYISDQDFVEKISVIDELLDYLVMELYLNEFLKSNLIEKVKPLLKQFELDKSNQVKNLKGLILKIEENQNIQEEIHKIKKNLILDEKELEIKLLKVGCKLDD